MPRPTLRTCLGNRKDTWCCCWPLTTCCSPPSRTAAVLPAHIWWSTVGGGGSTLGGAVCYFPQQPTLSRCPTAQAGSWGWSTVWRLQLGYLPGPLGDSADAGPAWWWTSFLSSWLRHAWWWGGGGGQSSEDNNMKSYGFVSHWANEFWSDLSLQAGVLLATVILVTLWHHPLIPSGLDLLPLPHLSAVRRHHRCRQLLPPILFVIIIRVEYVHAGGACCCCCCIAYA